MSKTTFFLALKRLIQQGRVGEVYKRQTWPKRFYHLTGLPIVLLGNLRLNLDRKPDRRRLGLRPSRVPSRKSRAKPNLRLDLRNSEDRKKLEKSGIFVTS